MNNLLDVKAEINKSDIEIALLTSVIDAMNVRKGRLLAMVEDVNTSLDAVKGASPVIDVPQATG